MKLIHPFSQPGDVHPKILEMKDHFLIGENNQWYDLSAGTGCNILGFTSPDIQMKVAETGFKFANDDWTTKSTPWFDLERSLEKVLPDHYNSFVPALTGSDSVDNALKLVWRYWNKRQRSKHTILVRKGSFHSGSITGWQMTYDQDWIKDWPDVKFVSFFDENFEEVYKRHRYDLAAVIIDTVNWYKGIDEIQDSILKLIEQARQETGCLLIADEILTGMWRMGYFSHSLHKGIEPDMLCFGKALTGGFGTLALTVMTDHVYETIKKFDISLWDNFPIAVGNTRSQSNTGATAASATIEYCLEHNIGKHVLEVVTPFVERIANKLSTVKEFDVTHKNSILYCRFDGFDEEQQKILSGFLNSHKLWNSEYSRIWFLSFYNLNTNETDYIESVFDKFVTLINNGKIWDQNNWKNN